MHCLLKLLSLERMSFFITQDYRLVQYTMAKQSKELLAEKQHCKVSKKVWDRRHGDQSSDKKSSPEVV